MTQASEPLHSLTSDDWATLDDIIERFETAWRRGERPQLGHGLPPSGAIRDAALLELVRGELEVRLKAGEPARVESYLEHFPEIAADHEQVLSLVAQEYELRRRQEPHLNLDDYEKRFPQFGAGLAARLQSAASGRTSVLDKSVAPPRPLSPAIDTVATLATVLAECRLLEPHQLHEVGVMQAQAADPKALARDLAGRGWLTPWQVNQIFLRRAGELRLGNYLLLDRLGEGGMGTVYKARHSVMRRLVALKVIRRDKLASTDSVRRFYREVRAVARLSHPNIVLAYDAQQVGGTHFLVMEYVDGVDLAKVVRRQGALAVAQACEYIRQAALGLQHAHEMGLVHRDVKPGNMLVAHPQSAHGSNPGSVGTIKLLDLGLARLQLAADERTAGDLTGEGAVMGTLDYISPEQAYDARNVDIRADIYSLGCSLYHLLTGRVPFAEATMAQKLVHHQVKEPPPVEKARPEVSPALAAVLRRMMAKKPEDRYQTPADVAESLAPFCPGGGSAAAVPAAVQLTEQERALLKEAPLATLVSGPAYASVATVAQGATLDLPAPSAAAPTMTMAPAPVPVQIIPPAGQPAAPARAVLEKCQRWFARLTPRGRLIAIGAAAGVPLLLLLTCLLWPGSKPPPEPDNRTVLERLSKDKIPKEDLVEGQPKELVAVLGQHRPHHHNSLWFAKSAKGGKWLVTADNYTVIVSNPTTLRQTFDRPLGSGALDVSADDTLLARAAGNGKVEIWDLKGQGKEPLARLDLGKDPSNLALTADGRGLLVAFSTPEAAYVREWRAWKSPKDTAELPDTIKDKDAGTVSQVAISADGTRGLTVTDNTIQVWDLLKREPLHKPLRHKTRINWAGFARADEAVLFYCSSAVGLHRWDPASGKVENFTGHTQPGVTRCCVSLSSDGKFAVVGSDGSTGQPKTYEVYDLQTRTWIQWRPERGMGGPLTFVPDGERVVLHSDREFRLIEAIKNNEILPPAGHSRPVSLLQFSQDGASLASMSSEDRSLCVWELASAQQTRLESRRVRFPTSEPTPRVVAVSADQHYAAATDNPIPNGRPIDVWEIGTGLKRFTLPVPKKSTFHALAFMGDRNRLLSLGDDGSLREWDLTRTADKQVARHEVFKGADLRGPLVLRGEQAYFLHNGAIVQWDLKAKKEVRRLGGGVGTFAVSGDGKRIYVAVGSEVGHLAIEGEQVVHHKYGNWHGGSPVVALALSPDGKTLVSGGADGLAIVWDTTVSPPTRPLTWHMAPYAPTALAFAPDSRHFAAGNNNGTIYILRLK